MINALITATAPNNWRESDADALAAALNADNGIPSMLLDQFLGAAMQAGASDDELSKLWGAGDYLQRAERLLADGNYARMAVLIATMPRTVAAETRAACLTALNGLRLTVAEAHGISGTVTGESVSTWLTGAGWTWDEGTTAWVPTT